MRLPVVPLIGVGLLIAISRGDSPTERLICGENTYDVEPPMFAQTVEDEAHFRCASGFELVGKKIVTCATTSWDHEFPSCRELPHRTLTPIVPTSHPCFANDDSAAPEDVDVTTPSEVPDNTLPLIPKRGPRPVSPRRAQRFPEQFDQYFSSPKTTEFEPVAKALQQRNAMAINADSGSDDDDIGDGDWLTEDQPE